MVSNAQQLTFAIKATNQAQQALREVQGDLDKLAGSGEKAGSRMGPLKSALGDVSKLAGGFVLAQGLTKLPGVMSGLSDTARDLELQQKKITTVFGDQLPVINDWANEAAHAMGLTKNEAKNLAAGAADLLIPMGFTREAATGMSTDMLGLAGALSEWSGGTTTSAEAADVLTKAMLGERDGLKALGISISEADVQARLLEKGQKGLTGTALEQAKAQSTLELVMEKSTDAQAAFADGAGSASRKQAEASARMQELQERIAVGLQPAIVAMSTLLTDKLVPGFELLVAEAGKVAEVVTGKVEEPIQKMIAFFQENESAMHAAAAAIGGVMVVAFGALAVAAGTAAVSVIAASLPLIAVAAAAAALSAGVFLLIRHWDDITARFPVLGTIADNVKIAAEGLADFFTGTLVPTLQGLAETALEVTEKVVGYFRDNWATIEGLVKPVVDQVVAHLTFLWDTAVDLISFFKNVFTGDFKGAWEDVKDIVGNFKTFFETTFRNLVTFLGNLVPLMLTAGEKLMGAVKDGAESLWTNTVKPFFEGLPGNMKDILVAGVSTVLEGGRLLGGAILDGLLQGLKALPGLASGLIADVSEALKEIINRGIQVVNNAIPDKISIKFGPDINLPNNPIPMLAEGGIVTRPTLALIGERGPEAVLPLAGPYAPRGGFGGTVINNYFQVNGSVVTLRELAYELKRLGPVV